MEVEVEVEVEVEIEDTKLQRKLSIGTSFTRSAFHWPFDELLLISCPVHWAAGESERVCIYHLFPLARHKARVWLEGGQLPAGTTPFASAVPLHWVAEFESERERERESLESASGRSGLSLSHSLTHSLTHEPTPNNSSPAGSVVLIGGRQRA